MSRQYFMGIDNGGSATKCVIFDTSGCILGTAVARVSMRRSGNGATERDAEAVFCANCDVIRRALTCAGLQGCDISGIGICGYGGGLCMLDESGDPVSPLIVSTDSRAQMLLSNFEADGTSDLVYAITLQRLWAGQPAVLLPWLKQNEPVLYSRCRHIVMIKDYIRYRLTGVLGTECTDASNTNLFNVRTRQFDKKLFSILGIEEIFDCVPQTLFSSCETSGYITEDAALLTGLRIGTPVATGLYDVASCCLASAILDEQTLCLIVGTWSISGHITSRLTDCIGKNNTLLSFLEPHFFLEESSPTSASNLDWLVEHFFKKMLPAGGGDIYAQCDAIVAGIDPTESDLIFLPFLYGSNAVSGGKGCFFNLASHHTSAHVLTAVYEGILFSLLHHVYNLYGSAFPQRARLSGGASRSAVWCQMLADILNIPLETVSCDELGALGGAMCAAIAVGAVPDYTSAAAQMSHVARTYFPCAERVAFYRQKYALYQKAICALQVFQQN